MLVVLIPSKTAEIAETTQHTATAPTIIDKFTATNNGASDATLNVHLTNGTGASDSNRILSIAIDAGKAYLCPEIVGAVLSAGDLIVTTSTVASITIRASGRR